ncbi:MAG: hypothetical protein Q7T97_16485 [Burkholderiaceae bacterium]|nr:hypothetical protein [Burkholderiaceae bacterium]
MSISNITGVGRVEPATASERPSENSPRTPLGQSSSDAVRASPDESSLSRFPWLSWQTRQLEVASKQPSPYGNIPLLGKELDQKV